ncbi:protein saal1 isoform X2 [Anabrus simplex]|uniref:protein saal1 isoform X2 n=1 Tax=Anabrus simplex TaxID=316456 RepID=UPI0035A30495
MASNNYNPPPSSDDEGGMNRGDAVGSTMYSECWILKILMQLTKLNPDEWNSDLESEVCVLWDMSAEEDVVNLLMKHNMFGLATHVVVNFDNCRLTEIMVGIIGNMCCVESVRTELGRRTDVVEVLLELLSMPDVPTLLQVLRVLQTCAWDVKNRSAKSKNGCGVKKAKDDLGNKHESTESSFVKDDISDKDMRSDIQVMSDDVNMELEVCEDKLSESLSTEEGYACQSEKLTKLNESSAALCEESDHPWLQHFMKTDLWRSKVLFILTSSKHDLMMALVESYKEFFEESFKTYETNDIEPVKKAASHWVSVLYSFTLHKEGVEVLCLFKADVLSCLFNMLHYCHSLLALDEELATFITSAVAILDVIFAAEPHEWSHFTSGLLSTIKLWEELSESKSVKLQDNESMHLEEESMNALEEFFTSVHKWLEEKKTDDSFKKLHFIHKQLSKLLNSRVT